MLDAYWNSIIFACTKETFFNIFLFCLGFVLFASRYLKSEGSIEKKNNTIILLAIYTEGCKKNYKENKLIFKQ